MRSIILASLILLQSACLWRPLLARPSLQDELVYTVTGDGWKIAMHHYRPAPGIEPQKIPVVICHGISANERMWSLEKGRSFPRYLADRGWDVWAIDLRGVGDSEKPWWINGKNYDYPFDAYVTQDVPAVISEVLKRTGAQKVNWVGHSLGGMIIYAHIATYGDAKFQTFIPVASPMGFSGMNKYFAWGQRHAESLRNWIPSMPNDFLVATIAPAGRRFHLGVEYIFWNFDNMDDNATPAFMYNTIGNMASGVLRQLAGAFATDQFTSVDGKVNYVTGLNRLTIPILVVAGMADNLCPPQNVMPVYDSVPSHDKTLRIFARANGDSFDYGHVDLTIGDTAQAEVYPELETWMRRRQ